MAASTGGFVPVTTAIEVAPEVLPAKSRKPRPAAGASVFERLAKDPNVSIEKLERLLALKAQEDMKAAETAFQIAMATAQRDMRPVAVDADNPQTHSKYATLAALDRALRPIYTAHGFAMSYNTADVPGDPLAVRVLCDVSHIGGHVKQYRIDMPADGKGAKGGDVMTRTHATGSAVSYGMRYLLKMIWNIATGRERDDDGNAAGRREPEPDAAPAGFDDWFADIGAMVQGGCTSAALQDAWFASSEAFRRHASINHRATVEGWKATAQKAGTR